MAYAEYPKMMTHPAHRGAILSKDEIVNGKLIKAPPGQPEKFPDVYVQNVDQEKQYASLGYKPNGVSDPEAYHRAMAGAEEPSGHKHHEYPRYMYRADPTGDVDVDVNHEHVTVKGALIRTEDERRSLRGDWFETPMQAAEFSLMEDEEPVAVLDAAPTQGAAEGSGGSTGGEGGEGGSPSPVDTPVDKRSGKQSAKAA